MCLTKVIKLQQAETFVFGIDSDVDDNIDGFAEVITLFKEAVNLEKRSLRFFRDVKYYLKHNRYFNKVLVSQQKGGNQNNDE